MRSFLKQAALALGLVAITATGCDTFETKVEKKLEARGLNKAQAEVGAIEGFRQVFTKKTEKDDGTVTYDMNYSGISEEDVLYTVERMHKDLKDTLEFDGSIASVKYFESTGIGEHIKLEEKIFKFHTDMLRKDVLKKKFEKLIKSEYMSTYFDPFSISESDRYSLASVYPLGQEEVEFDAEYVKAARKAGKFEGDKAIVEKVIQQYTFLEKVPNPRYVIDKGEPQFIHEKKQMGLRIVSYDLDNDDEHMADYVEVFRLDSEGKSESKPAVKIFRPNGVGTLEIAVADQDFQGQPGFGIPDYVGKVRPIDNGSDILGLDNLIGMIFGNAKKGESGKTPDLSVINKVYVAKAGTIPMGLYETDDGGWEQYVPSHPAKPSNTHIKLGSPVGTAEPRPGDIEWIALEYSGQARVVEFYRPNAKFSGKKLNITANGMKVSIVGADGRIENYDIRAIIEEKPYRIDFDRNHQKRWEIRDKDGDGIHYEAKRERARTDDVIPK